MNQQRGFGLCRRRVPANVLDGLDAVVLAQGYQNVGERMPRPIIHNLSYVFFIFVSTILAMYSIVFGRLSTELF